MIIKAWVCYQGGLFPKIHCCPMRNGIIDIWMIDESSGKKLMMDLFFFGQGTRWKENDIYHYAAQVADVKEDVWTEVDVDLDYNIDQAIRAAAEGGMNFQKEHLKIYQVEILEELRYAWGKLLIGSFELTY